MSRAQEKAKSFIDEHNVEKIISEMLNSLVHSRDPNPVIFMVSVFTLLICPLDKIFVKPGYRARVGRAWHSCHWPSAPADSNHHLPQI